MMLVKARITCGILLCEENLPPTNTPDSLIFNMSVFKIQPSCSRTPEDESESRVLVASINSKHPNISRVTDATQTFGILGSRNASLRIEMFKHDDCSSDFTCEVQGLDGQGRSFLSTTTLLQQPGDNMDYEVLASSLREVKDKVEDVRNQVHTLENRIEDKIDAKLSAVNKNDTCARNEAAFDKKLSTLRRELSDAQQNAVTIILDYIDARLFSNQVQLIHKLKDSISEAMLSNDNTLKGILNTMGSNQRKTQSTLAVIDGQLSRMNKSLMATVPLSTCKRGLISLLSSYPYPYPVIYPRDKNGLGLPYLCDMDTDGGGWIVIQRRSTGKVNFYRDWATYKNGFGTLDEEFWLGNERIHAFTSSGIWELRVDLRYKEKEAYALYSNFEVESESKQYTLRIGNYSGTARNALHYHKGRKFSTYDRDNDGYTEHCAGKYKGGWWYYGCFTSNLNAVVGGSELTLYWTEIFNTGYCTFSEMKIRRVA
ncbi:ficolin-1 [Plakobranchus ocellatus]|uniref:Ficolin-1 n=1 Tax=Plakobranchus ocellatus TaxID=259542 RepID=A0AAV4DUD2_9GAST|nr:ficolin-1 [Plakobranchus ocellatus]